MPTKNRHVSDVEKCMVVLSYETGLRRVDSRQDLKLVLAGCTTVQLHAYTSAAYSSNRGGIIGWRKQTLRSLRMNMRLSEPLICIKHQMRSLSKVAVKKF